jgi:hypothetical protein
MLLDAVYDEEAIYRLLHHQNIESFIDLNKRSQKTIETSGVIDLSPEGIPFSRMGTR